MLTIEQIEKEVHARVNFKMDELMTGLRNRIKSDKTLGFAYALEGNPPQNARHTHYAEALSILTDMLEKERAMPTPDDEMHRRAMHKAKESAVRFIADKIFNGVPTPRVASTIADAVERAQMGGEFYEPSSADVYLYKGMPYSIFCETKMKLGDDWVEVVIYRARYHNADGEFWVREKEQFYKLFQNISHG